MTPQELKQGILLRAIQGKLVEQRPEEGTGEELFETITFTKNNSLVEISEDEIPFEIPDSWKWVRHNTLFEIVGGSQPPKSKFIDQPKSGYVRLYQIRDYGDKPVPIYVPVDMVSKFTKKEDILLARYGGSLGKVFWAEEGAYNVAMAKVVALFSEGPVNKNYLYYYYFAPLYQNLVKGNSRSAQAGFNKEDLDSLMFPLPPLAEQKRIVSKIEELMPLVEEYDKLEDQRNTLDAEFSDKLRKSILQQAIQGKLTERDPADEPASDLLKRIRAEKERLIKEGKIKKEKPLPPITEEEMPFEIPENWAWARIGDLFEVNPRNSVSDDTEVGFIPMPLLEPGYVNKHTYEKRLWKDIKNNFTHFQNGDIVFAKITPCFQNRKSAIICGLPNGYGAGTTELHVLRSYSGLVLNEYALWFVKNERFIVDGVEHFTGSVGQQRVGTDFIKQYPFPLPPLAEQQRIVDRVNELLAMCDELNR